MDFKTAYICHIPYIKLAYSALHTKCKDMEPFLMEMICPWFESRKLVEVSQLI